MPNPGSVDEALAFALALRGALYGANRPDAEWPVGRHARTFARE
jgi:hypothetical protein